MPSLSTFLIVAAVGAVLILIGILLKGKFAGLILLWGILILGVTLILAVFYNLPFLEILPR